MRVAVIDTETNGIPDQVPYPAVFEVAAVVLELEPNKAPVEGPAPCVRHWNATEIGTFESLVWASPEALGRWADEALQINGLTREMLAHAPPAYDVGDALARFLVGHGVRWLTAFRNEFDFSDELLASREWLRPYLEGGIFSLAPCLREAYCALRASDASAGHSLVDAMLYFAPVITLPPGLAHTASWDARAASLLLPWLLPEHSHIQLEPVRQEPLTRAQVEALRAGAQA